MKQRKRIAVLGAGIGSLSAIFELTSIPGWQDRFEIVVYQMGWLLGGKGASVRNRQKFCRNEEHGLHVWLGFYDNAFDIVQRCYEELDPAHGHAWSHWTDAFSPLESFVLFDPETGPNKYQLPPKGGEPGKRNRREFVFWNYAVGLFKMAENRHRNSPMADYFDSQTASEIGEQVRKREKTATRGNLPKQKRIAETHKQSWAKVPANEKPAERITTVLDRVDSTIRRMPRDPRLHTNADRAILAADLDTVTMRFSQLDRSMLIANRDMLVDWELLGVAFAILRGMIVDNVITEGFDVIEDNEWSDWLSRHGVHPDALRSAPVRACYDLVFGYAQGDPARPSVGAGTGTHCLLRMLLDYRGAAAYELNAGMGESVFTPLYLVLKDRGVRFEFFCRVEALLPSADGSRIETIRFVRQARTLDGSPYHPLICVKSLQCWPEAPLFEQLQDGAALEAGGFASVDADGAGEQFGLALGTGFDEVLLGIPLPELGKIATDVAAMSLEWQKMLSFVSSTATMSAQIWTGRVADWRGPEKLRGAFGKPLDTVWNAQSVLQHEEFPDTDRPGSAMYLCGVLPGPDSKCPSEANGPDNEARNLTKEWLDSEGPTVWSSLTQRGVFDWSSLYDPLKSVGPGRLGWQHVSANHKPWARYVQSLPGTKRYRLRSDRSGFDNLYLAGDWTLTALSAGCMEAAVMSGLRAARGISGHPIEISGEDEQTGAAPALVELVKKQFTRIDDASGVVDAVGVVLALPRDALSRMVPAGLRLAVAPGLPKGMHPLGVLFCSHTDVRPSLAPVLLSGRYNEVAFALPFVRKAAGADGEDFTILPLLMLDDLLAAGAGFVLGFNKKLARLEVRHGLRRATTILRGTPLLDLETSPSGPATRMASLPRFELARTIFQQPVLLPHLGGLRRAQMDFGLENAWITPHTGRLSVLSRFLTGLEPDEISLPGVDSSTFGAFGFTSRWFLDAGLLPNRRSS